MSTFDDSRSLSSSSCSAALPVLPAQSSVQAVQRDVTSISLRRIDRACYQDRCDVHSDTSDDTDSPTRRAAKTLSTRATSEAVRTASRWSRARGIDDGVPAMGPDEGPGSKTRAEAAVWGHGEPRARKTALGREELLYKNPAWVLQSSDPFFFFLQLCGIKRHKKRYTRSKEKMKYSEFSMSEAAF